MLKQLAMDVVSGAVLAGFVGVMTLWMMVIGG